MTMPAARRGRFAAAYVVAACVLIAGCASRPLDLYTLNTQAVASDATPLPGKTTVIEVRRAAIPDYLDSQDIIVRDGNTLERSTHGRWASRLSVGATSYLTNQLARRRPDALVTDQSQVETPNYRIFITIGTLDVTSDGVATLEADWVIVPRNASVPTQRQRTRVTANGPVANDQDVVLLNQAVLTKLADAIDVASLR